MFLEIRLYCQNIINSIPADRLLSLDVMRGITITAMVLVNNPGSWSYVYSPMGHAAWDGWTPTDLIFPFFLFMVGISIVLAFEKRVESGIPPAKLYRSIIIRCGKLVGLGLLLGYSYARFYHPEYNFFDSLAGKRLPGVLQRIGIVYLVTSIIVLNFTHRGRINWFIALLAFYWLAMIYFPYSYTDATGVVHHLAGNLEMGKNFANFVDHHVFGLHIWKKHIEPFGHDPEGVLSTIPSIASCLAGVFTATLLRNKQQTTVEKVVKMYFVAMVSLFIGQVLNYSFPINKALWSPAFVFHTTGMALIFLASLTYIVDLKSKKLWSAPFIVFGANAIAFYSISTVLGGVFNSHIRIGGKSLVSFLFEDVYQPVLGHYGASLAYSISLLLLMYFIMNYMYKKNVFWKV